MWLFIQAGIKVKPCYWKGPLVSSSGVIWYAFMNTVPLNTRRNNTVVITSKWRHCDVIASKWRRFDAITASLLCNVSAGVSLNTMSPAVSSPANTLYFTWITSMQSRFCQISSRWTIPHWSHSSWVVVKSCSLCEKTFYRTIYPYYCCLWLSYNLVWTGFMTTLVTYILPSSYIKYLRRSRL